MVAYLLTGCNTFVAPNVVHVTRTFSAILLVLPPAPLCDFALQGGVVLAADTRSTSGSTVADKNCEKIHYIAPNIYCCGAGTAADTENVTGG